MDVPDLSLVLVGKHNFRVMTLTRVISDERDSVSDRLWDKSDIGSCVTREVEGGGGNINYNLITKTL